jgi:hypothetical protein
MNLRLTASIAPILVGLAAAPARATDLHLKLQSAGQSTVTVGPGQVVSYDLVGELSDLGTQGLAMFRCDLDFSGGNLSQASAPSSFPMLNFQTPLGFSNPQGFGGTPSSGNLLQVGGAQNTINNTAASYPTGSVILGVAQNGAPLVLASGSLTAPAVAGDYTLSLSNADANGIRLGETGSPFWAVDAVCPGTVTNLTLKVRSLVGNVGTISLLAGGTQTLSLDAGTANAGKIYFMAGGVSGTSPGFPLGPGLVVPINVDALTLYYLANPNTPPLLNGLNVLNGLGKSTAFFSLPAASDPSLAGIGVDHAYVTVPVDYVSNAEHVQLVP